MTEPSLSEENLRTHVRESLREDIGDGDVTTAALPDSDELVTASLITRESGVLAGQSVFSTCFEELPDLIGCSGPPVQIDWDVEDGDRLEPGTSFGFLKGPVDLILTGERVALNYLQQLSGVATLTREMVDRARPHGVDVYDTRKTVPHHRALQKYAVRCGGGTNHRMDLSGAALIKDNHKNRAGGILPILERLAGGTPVILEIHSLDELTEDLRRGMELGNFDIQVVMLDNVSAQEVPRYRERLPESVHLEVSGGITLANLERYCQTNIDQVSVGALTHSFDSLDVSLQLN